MATRSQSSEGDELQQSQASISSTQTQSQGIPKEQKIEEAYSKLEGRMFEGTYVSDATFQYQNDAKKWRIVRSQALSIKDILDEITKTFTINSNELIWKGFVWKEDKEAFDFYVEIELDESQMSYYKGKRTNYRIVKCKPFGKGLNWRELKKYEWRRGVCITVRPYSD